jgi:hypothetical protein
LALAVLSAGSIFWYCSKRFGEARHSPGMILRMTYTELSEQAHPAEQAESDGLQWCSSATCYTCTGSAPKISMPRILQNVSQEKP